MSFLVIAAVGALVGMIWAETRLTEPGPLAVDKDIFIAPHTDLTDIIDKLESEGVIDNPLTLNVALTVERKRGKVRAGEYLFKAHASLRNVIDTLVSGKQIQQAITIPEGLTSAQVVQRLRDDTVLVGEIRDIPKEGALLPETYKFVRGSSRSEILDKMEQLDRRVVEQIWARRAPDLPLRSPYEMVTLASIVEKETGKADERPMVAGVFINRLQKHMHLDSDPTVVYGLVAGQGTLGHAITRPELDKRTPYNTYHIEGLPPGPIDNPGRAALEAVANPSRTPNLYFVADGTGGHAFSSTIDEHNRNVLRWREIEREAKDKVDVDKLSPNAVTPPQHGNQRSDADPAYGHLPTNGIVTVSDGRRPSFADPAINHDITRIASLEEKDPGTRRHKSSAAALKKLDTLATTASLDALGFSIEGGKPFAVDILDGPITADPKAADANAAAIAAQTIGSLAPLPASSADSVHRADATTAAALKPGTASPMLDRLTASVSADATKQAAQPPGTKASRADDRRLAKASLDALPSEKQVDLFADPNPASAEPPPPLKTPPLHPKIYDASEGTPSDPLLDKTYDLNTGKTIPSEFLQH